MLVAEEYELSMECSWDDADGENLKYSETSILSEGTKGKKCKMLEITPAEKF